MSYEEFDRSLLDSISSSIEFEYYTRKAGIYNGDYPMLYSDIESPQSKNFIEKNNDEIKSWYKDTIKKDNNETI